MNVCISVALFTWKENYVIEEPHVLFDSAFENVLLSVWLYKEVIHRL